MSVFYRKLVGFVGSKLFFGLTLAVFAAQATWIAFSARYPMAFDEAYHLGLIKLHAQQFSPIFVRQPPGPAPYGAITRDPSYLYHWLMSFPYRWLQHAPFMNQIITLRLINVVLFCVGLWLFWLVLRQTKASAAAINLAIVLFAIIPVTSLLAAHINYDNLLFPCVAGSLLLLLAYRRQLIEKHIFNTRLFLGWLAVVSLAAEVKYPFLPILAGEAVYLIYLWYKLRRHKWRWDWHQVAFWQRALLVAATTIGLCLFTFTYGVNLILYQNPIPQCGQVLGVQRCLAYGPWARNYHAAQMRNNNPNFFYFLPNWIWGMFERLFFVINSASGPEIYANWLAPILAGTAVIGTVVGLGNFAKHSRQLLQRDRVLGLLMFVMAWYIVALFGRNYHDYVQLGRIVAVNGRYFVPIILPFILATVIGWQLLLQRAQAKTKVIILTVVALLCLQGGGLISFIVYSDANWYWPGDHRATQANQDLQKVIKPLVWAPKIR